ncbi:ceramide kinase-like [Saccoglossus kowalevskii]|uniref:Ceramide kinase-like n=1 Tax=Saccoglossus kowalevskii TaxID=10224 RepID=A0ABM0MKP1_SACKO|nr:PREDICTED: ceramide kinase-like [Saccoglossus kowalevskii]
MASQTEGIILSTVVTLNGKSNRLTLSGSHLCWSPTFPERAQYHQHYVKVTEIITVKAEYEFHPGGHYEKYSKYSKINTIELLPKKSNVFSVYMIKRNGRHKWKDRKVSFHCRDSSCANDWIENINRTINKQDVSRPQRLLVFINPVGGKGKGCKIYREKVAPLFELAGIVTEVIVTERSNHAKDILQEKELHKIDGVISVSGDGMASEVVNGLLLRAQKDAGINFNDKKSKLVSLSHRVGIIPAGSTDTIVHSTVGTSDPVTSTLHIILVGLFSKSDKVSSLPNTTVRVSGHGVQHRGRLGTSIRSTLPGASNLAEHLVSVPSVFLQELMRIIGMMTLV